MFVLTGTVGGKAYNNAEISAKDLAEIFGLDVSKAVEFGYVARRVVKDRLNGGVRKPNGIALKTRFDGTYNGQSVSIHYYRNKIAIDNNRFNYLPNTVGFSENRYHPEEKMDALVFLLLHPFNENSPIKGSGAKYYRVIDRQRDAQKKRQEFGRIAEIRAEILEMQDAEPNRLRAMGRGLVLPGGYRARIQDFTTMDEVAVSLIEMLEQHKSAFITAWQSPATELQGMIQTCFDKGVLKVNNSGNIGHVSWSKTGELLCKYQTNSDLLSQVVAHVLNHEEINLPRLRQELRGDEPKSNVKTKAAAVEKAVAHE